MKSFPAHNSVITLHVLSIKITINLIIYQSSVLGLIIFVLKCSSGNIHTVKYSLIIGNFVQKASVLW